MVKVRDLAVRLALLGLIVMPNGAAAIDISSSGTWSPNTTASDLTAGAGSDLVTSCESTLDSITLSISTTTGVSDNWRVDVRRSDVSWPADAVISVKRTSAGSGAGSISGGTSYQAITASNASFFSGSGDRSNISIQVQISGIALSIAPGTYSTSIIYAVVDTL